MIKLSYIKGRLISTVGSRSNTKKLELHKNQISGETATWNPVWSNRNHITRNFATKDHWQDRIRGGQVVLALDYPRRYLGHACALLTYQKLLPSRSLASSQRLEPSFHGWIEVYFSYSSWLPNVQRFHAPTRMARMHTWMKRERANANDDRDSMHHAGPLGSTKHYILPKQRWKPFCSGMSITWSKRLAR